MKEGRFWKEETLWGASLPAPWLLLRGPWSTPLPFPTVGVLHLHLFRGIVLLPHVI